MSQTNIYNPAVIRNECIKEHKQLLELAIKTLTAKGCTVHLAKDSAEAASIIHSLCKENQNALCTFSSELEEIALSEIVPQAMQTDIEKIVADGLGKGFYNRRRAPFDDVSPDEITGVLKEFINTAEAENIINAASRYVKEKANESDWGITGLDAIAADTGTIILAEDQGNERVVSNIPARHLAVAGLEKLYPSNDTALESIHAAWKAGTQYNAPVYYSYITGPSRTGDIEGAMVCGMHGPLAVHVILLDNGRSTLLEQSKADVLKCIECGKCSASLMNVLDGMNILVPLNCKTLALANLKNSYQITDEKWDACSFECPVNITVDDLRKAMQ
ncbi:MAG: lactate utilization protein [Peptococcaceae bacterium]|nr:lactate utilization protein [Peptococcaceae bacterium]MBQ3509895.1 lactate utilization protein [Peptococcaceae bacterium]MBQ7025962.1 lactate utilization protein [Peptococcaceae bacterium]